MLDPKFISVSTDAELAQSSTALDLLIKSHYARLGTLTKKLSPMPTINPAILELKSKITAEMESRKNAR